MRTNDSRSVAIILALMGLPVSIFLVLASFQIDSLDGLVIWISVLSPGLLVYLAVVAKAFGRSVWGDPYLTWLAFALVNFASLVVLILDFDPSNKATMHLLFRLYLAIVGVLALLGLRLELNSRAA